MLPYFNQAHQHSGDQQRALANGVLMYAKHIDKLDALGDLVATIVNKHVALQIRAEHYPLVGASLLQAIREVLGAEVASDAVIDAWGAAYGQLADILAGEEGRIYKAQAAAPGGWSGARDFLVRSKTLESERDHVLPAGARRWPACARLRARPVYRRAGQRRWRAHAPPVFLVGRQQWPDLPHQRQA